MTSTYRTVLAAASDGGVMIERYTGKARNRADNRLVSAPATHRAIAAGHLLREVRLSLDFHYGISESGREALASG